MFLAEADRAKSFASRAKRSASVSWGVLRSASSSSGTSAGRQALGTLRAATPSPRKMATLEQRRAAVWRQASAAAAHVSSPQAGQAGGGSSGEEEEEEEEEAAEEAEEERSELGYSSSEAGSYSSSPGSSFTAGSPSRGSALGSPLMSGGPSMQRAATSRGAGNLMLRLSSPGREISTHLRVSVVLWGCYCRVHGARLRLASSARP